MPGESAVRCRIDTYSHKNRGRTLQGMMTSIVCTQLGTHTPTGSPSLIVTPTIPAWQAKLTSIAPNAGATYRSASTSAPTNPRLSDLWYQTDTQLMKRYSGTAWENTGASPLEESETVGVDFENSSGNVKIYSDGTMSLTGGITSGTQVSTSDRKARLTSTITDADEDGLIISSGDIDSPVDADNKVVLGHTRTSEPGLKSYEYVTDAWRWISEFVSFITGGAIHSDWSISSDGGTTKGMISLIEHASTVYHSILTGIALFAPSGDGDTDLGEASRRFGKGYFSDDVTIAGDVIEQSATQWGLGSQAINCGTTWTIPKGTYLFYRIDPLVSAILQVKDASTWYSLTDVTTMGTINSDGTNMRLRNNNSDTNTTIYWRKKP